MSTLRSLLCRYRYALVVFGFSRAALFLAVYMGLAVVPQMASGDGLWRTFPGNLLLDGFVRFDSGWYLGLADTGYSNDAISNGQLNTAFFPAYPLLLSLARILGGREAMAAWGVVASNASFAIGLCFMYDIATRLTSTKSAKLAVALAAFSPFSFFFSAVYTESLFFMASSASFLFALRGSLFPSMIAAALSGGTRVVGIAIIPFAYLVYLQTCNRGARRPHAGKLPLGLFRQLIAASAIGSSPVIAHLLYLQVRFGSFLQFAHSQSGWWSNRSLIHDLAWTWLPILDPNKVMRGEVHVMGIINCIFAALALALIITGIFRKTMPKGILLWALVVMFISSTVWFSAGRFASSLFPVYILAAIFFRKIPPEALVGSSAILMSLFAFFFSHWHWVA